MSLGVNVETFLAVCEERGFGRAARRLGISQPAVSYRIRQLEATLGTAVIKRGTGRFQLMAAGRRLAESAVRFRREVDSLREELTRGGADLEGPLRVATVSGFGRYVLCPALLAMGVARLECYFRTAEEVLSLLRDGEVDLGFSYRRLPSRAVQFTPIYREELVLIVPPKGGPWRKVDWADGGAESVPFITYTEHDYVFGCWFSAVVGRQPRHLPVAGHFDELEETIAAVAAGRGASIVPRDAARSHGGQRVSIVRPAGRRAFNQVFLAEPARGLTPTAREVALELGATLGRRSAGR